MLGITHIMHYTKRYKLLSEMILRKFVYDSIIEKYNKAKKKSLGKNEYKVGQSYADVCRFSPRLSLACGGEC